MKNKTLLVVILILLSVGLGYFIGRAQNLLKNTDESVNIIDENQGEVEIIEKIEQELEPELEVEPDLDRYSRYIAPECQINEGCNGPLHCVDLGTEPLPTTCAIEPHFVCYEDSDARCEKQLSGKCGWTETSEMSVCLRKHLR